jgi:L-fuconolactonase
MVQDIPEDDWLLRDELTPGFAALARHRLAFDALVLPRHLPRLARLVDRNPAVTFVIDHLAKPPVAHGALTPWVDDIAALAGRPNVMCKLSGLLTEAAPDWTIDDLRPYAAHVLACFGPDRVLWGSDWPVVDLAGGYDAWWQATEALLADLPPPDKAAILGGNARRVYLGKRGRLPC